MFSNSVEFEHLSDTERLKSVIIPDGVTSIGANAFHECRRLTTVSIPDSVTDIGDSAFFRCVWLKRLSLPTGVITIGNGAFDESGLAHLTIPDSVTDIGVGAFANCGELASVIVGGNVTNMGSGAFYVCQALKGVYFRGNIPAIDESIFPKKREKHWLQGDSAMFEGAKNVTVYRLPEAKGWNASFCDRPVAIWDQRIQAQYNYTNNNGTITITGYTGPGGTVTIPNNINGVPVTRIGDDAFRDCACLSSLTVADSVTSIGNRVFAFCYGMADITIPGSVTNIGDYAFPSCIGLEGVYFKGNAPDLGKNAFSENKTVIIYHLTNTAGWGTTYGGRRTKIWNPQTNVTTKAQKAPKKAYAKVKQGKKTSTPAISPVATGGDARLGVFSNHEDGFKTVSLMVDKSGRAYFATSVVGIIGDWSYDTNTCVLIFKFFDPEAGKDGSFPFRFNKEYRDYTIGITDSSDKSRILEFVTNTIPQELAEAFTKYPEAVKAERKRLQAMQEAKRLQAEKLAREEPEYQRTLQAIRDTPKIVLSDKKFYSKENTPSTRAFRTALGDSNIHFDEKILVELLDKLPPDNHWNREQIFARPELSSSTIERFYPKALDWGAHLNYTILANIATHPNTPIQIVEDLANRKDLPVGATQPAQERLKKRGTVENKSLGTSTSTTNGNQR